MSKNKMRSINMWEEKRKTDPKMQKIINSANMRKL